ncbi:MAG: hypothetical protein ACOCSP_02355 [archaeon]
MQPPTADLETEQQPPLSLPFAHFVTGAVLLLVGGGIAGLGPLVLPIQASNTGTLHLLLAGWVGLTIMGAMIQFVPVWSGTSLHSERLSVASLWLVLLGVAGVVAVFLTSAYEWFVLPATVLLGGFWLFAYTIFRTMPPVRTMDITEAHFLLALGNVVLGTSLGWLLATDIGLRILHALPVRATGVLPAHLTLTVFGFVSLTIFGALFQLSPMFTQSESGRIDAHLAHVEMVAAPVGVYLLAAGRLFQVEVIARMGAVAFLLGALSFAVYLFRRLWMRQVELGPMLKRYWLVALSLFGWVLLSVPVWILDPLSYFSRFGSPRSTHLLFIGVITFTIVGTFYHVVPFIIWFHRYSDRLGFEQVPMIDDLYDARLARIEFWLLAGGLVVLWIGELFDTSRMVLMVGGNVLGLGVILFAVNMGLVVWNHRPETGREVLTILGGGTPAEDQ